MTSLHRKLLPTTVVGSYSIPEWLERAKTDYFQRRISSEYLNQIHDVVIKSAIKDQELAGIDIVSDGELRRDNMIDHFTSRMPGVEIDQRAKPYFYDYYESVVRHKLPMGPLHLVDEFKFVRENTTRPIKFSVTGPFSLMRRIKNEFYGTERELAIDIARVMNAELKALVTAGADYIQADEPYFSGFPEDLGWGVEVINVLFEGVDARKGLHICYGNRYGKPNFEGNYRYLFPAVLDAQIDQLTLEFARKGFDDLDFLTKHQFPFELGVGVIDVKSAEVESPELVASRVQEVLKHLPPERVFVNPDCGLRHVPQEAAFRKLEAMVQGVELVRAQQHAGS
ncbi:MAG TPA: methionine synthase [Chloroflexota bacterium]|jgi:5-methyltetrahydropteroyltriglutamate--homocysteine methyltransferase|nr:methionine synthase [Chloroflexota bacterium]